MNHNWSATKKCLHPQNVAEISCHSVLSGDRIRQCGTSSGSRHKDTDQCNPTIREPGFELPRHRDTAVPAEGKMTYRHWSVSLWRDSDDVSHFRILSPDKTEWRLISATFCGWRHCFVADQLWFMTCIWEEEGKSSLCLLSIHAA